MFDLRRFWLGTAAYVLIIGAVIAAGGAAFNAFIGLPAKVHQQAVMPTAQILPSGSKVVPVGIERGVVAPGALPRSSMVQQAPATNIAVVVPQIIVPEPLIMREPNSARRGRPSRSGF